MDKKIYTIGFFVMLIVNAFLAFLIVKRPPHPAAPRDVKDRISQELNLSEEQRTLFFKMARAHGQQMREIGSEQRAVIKEYFGQLSNEPLEKANEETLVQILALEEKKLTATYAHFEELRALCTEDQLAHYDEIINEVIYRLLGQKGLDTANLILLRILALSSSFSSGSSHALIDFVLRFIQHISYQCIFLFS